MFDWKTVGHVFTKPVQIEEQLNYYFPQEDFFLRSSHLFR
jgi:hypothetical protein